MRPTACHFLPARSCTTIRLRRQTPTPRTVRFCSPGRKAPDGTSFWRSQHISPCSDRVVKPIPCAMSTGGVNRVGCLRGSRVELFEVVNGLPCGSVRRVVEGLAKDAPRAMKEAVSSFHDTRYQKFQLNYATLPIVLNSSNHHGITLYLIVILYNSCGFLSCVSDVSCNDSAVQVLGWLKRGERFGNHASQDPAVPCLGAVSGLSHAWHIRTSRLPCV